MKRRVTFCVLLSTTCQSLAVSFFVLLNSKAYAYLFARAIKHLVQKMKQDRTLETGHRTQVLLWFFYGSHRSWDSFLLKKERLFDCQWVFDNCCSPICLPSSCPGFWNIRGQTPNENTYFPFKSPSRLFRASTTAFSTPLRSARVQCGGKENPRMERPVRTRDDNT